MPRPKGSKNKLKMAHLEFMTELLLSTDYQVGLRERILSGQAKEIEKYFWEKTVGKPTDKIELSGSGPMFQIIATHGIKEDEDPIEE